MLKLNKEEKEILKSFERGEWKPVKNMKQELKKYAEYARATIQKDQRINIRMTSKDLNGLKVKAIEEGLPYQTLISSVLHKYVSGRLIDKKAS